MSTAHKRSCKPYLFFTIYIYIHLCLKHPHCLIIFSNIECNREPIRSTVSLLTLGNCWLKPTPKLPRQPTPRPVCTRTIWRLFNQRSRLWGWMEMASKLLFQRSTVQTRRVLNPLGNLFLSETFPLGNGDFILYPFPGCQWKVKIKRDSVPSAKKKWGNPGPGVSLLLKLGAVHPSQRINHCLWSHINPYKRPVFKKYCYKDLQRIYKTIIDVLITATLALW